MILGGKTFWHSKFIWDSVQWQQTPPPTASCVCVALVVKHIQMKMKMKTEHANVRMQSNLHSIGLNVSSPIVAHTHTHTHCHWHSILLSTIRLQMLKLNCLWRNGTKEKQPIQEALLPYSDYIDGAWDSFWIALKKKNNITMDTFKIK